MNLTIQQATNFTLAQLASLTNKAFTGYIGGDAHFEADTFATFLTRDGTDLSLSQVVLHNDEAIGLGLIARQGWSSRLALMGVVPEATGQGVGKWLLVRLIDAARQRGDRHFCLEVIEQNRPGVKLYQGAGFRSIRRLWGYTAQNLEASTTPGLTEIDAVAVAKQVTQHGADDLPWQVAGLTVAHMGPPYKAYQLGPAYAIISDPTQETVALRSLVVAADHYRHGYATRLVCTLMVTYPGKIWKVPAICPQGPASMLFEALGFKPEAINQFQMVLDLRKD